MTLPQTSLDPPVTVVHGPSPGDLHVYPSLADAEIAALPQEVKAGVLSAWDAGGRPLRATLEQPPSPVPGSVTRQVIEKVRLARDPERPPEPDALAERLRAALAGAGGGDAAREGTLDDLLARAAAAIGPRS